MVMATDALTDDLNTPPTAITADSAVRASVPAERMWLKRMAYSIKKCWALLLCLVVWLLTLGVYVSLAPQYTSEWALILPGSGDGHAVTLESIGQANASTSSPYASNALNPSVNYKALSMSLPILAQAAANTGLAVTDFGEPKIKLVDQTALLYFSINGRSAEQAQAKALAHYHALQRTLDQLRDDEMARLTAARSAVLSAFSAKLTDVQQEKLAFQARSGMLSVAQFQQLVARLAEEKQHLAKLTISAKTTGAQLSALTRQLGITEAALSGIINLRNDAVFQQYLVRHAEVHAQLASVSGSWGKNHPKRLQLEAAHHQINHDITARGRRLTADPSLSEARLVELGSSQFENPLLQQLIEVSAAFAAQQAQIEHTTAWIGQLQQQVDEGAADALQIEDLSRKQQVATAVFSTALAKQDIGQVDRFASYPLVQLLTPPTLPEQANTLKQRLVLVGGIFASLFIILGYIAICYRQRLFRALLKNA